MSLCLNLCNPFLIAFMRITDLLLVEISSRSFALDMEEYQLTKSFTDLASSTFPLSKRR